MRILGSVWFCADGNGFNVGGESLGIRDVDFRFHFEEELYDWYFSAVIVINLI